MESDLTSRQALRAAERAGAAPYLDYPPTPAWFGPVSGVWCACLILAYAAFDTRPWPAMAALAVLFAAELAFLRWYRVYRGTMPTLERIPVPEIARVMRSYAVRASVLAAGLIATYFVVGPPAAAVLALVAVPLGYSIYERRYEDAARAARERLG